jgi:putative intracellular protease/amidase
VLNGKKATVFPSAEAALKAKDAILTKEDVAAGGIVVTGVGPEAAKRFVEKLVEVLGGK